MATVSKGRTFVSGETVTPAKLNELVDNATVTAIQTADIADGQITNAKVSDSAAIALSKLANITAGQVLLGNASNVPTATALTGDVTVTSAGVTAIGSAKVLPAMLSQPYTLATAQNSTSGTSIDFTGIPSWAKRITVTLAGVSTNGTSVPLIQLGDSGGIETTGYAGVGSLIFNGLSAYVSNFTNGFALIATGQTGPSAIYSGSATITLVDPASNLWVCNGSFALENTQGNTFLAGKKSTSATLDRVRITTVNGADTFDAGTINISYEG